MRWGAFIFLSCLMACGCSSTHNSPKPSYSNGLRITQRSNTSALVFDPPVAVGQPELDLGRAGRAEEAFVGYDSLTATFYYLRTDDRQADDWGVRNDRYERRAISTKVGAVYR